ncbi:nascent polypeptide-associated complex subunit alpha, muscle-specific form isoform X6 [Alosa sapidissima]|uniref:nascent polypeptide-associated complex subunit alpha, muscle-specific form isoform X6 n=1 Tax=Alosa sapidissima TaxID=34773 RepID=UPI001C08E33B|nr:nascent polypeptide-associated complex subunit alpha, muscle-specific form isoform X6 [Alosa sapidissima]
MTGFNRIMEMPNVFWLSSLFGMKIDIFQDEVLAVSKRIVLRVEDLAKWACAEPPVWRGGHVQGHLVGKTTSSLTGSQQPKEEPQGGGEGSCVRVLSYPQYCRYRSLQKRVQELGGWPRLRDPHIKTLEGIRMVQHNTRVLYCRDTFNHPTLDSNACILTQLGFSSIRLKGRPRKRRGRYPKVPEQPTGQQSESWMERMNENVLGSAELQWAGGWLHHPEEQLFLDQLFSFMERQGSPISKVPNLGFKKIDLFLMYSVVKRLGGYENVTTQRMWKAVYNELGGSPGSTSAATCTRRHYERLMLPYEQFMNSGSKPPKTQEPVVPIKPMRGRPPLHLKRQKTNGVSPPQQAVTADGVVVVRRGRGRPPGRRKVLAARANQGRHPLLAKPPPSQGSLSPPPPQGPPAPAPPAVPQKQNHSTPLHSQVHTPVSCPPTYTSTPTSNPTLLPSTPLPAPPVKPEELKLEPQDLATPIPRFSGLSQALPREPVTPVSQTGGLTQGTGGLVSNASLAVFSPTKGLCPLDLFRTRLGLGTPLSSTPVPSMHLQSLVRPQARLSAQASPVTSTPAGPRKDPHPPPQNQYSGCVEPENQGPLSSGATPGGVCGGGGAVQSPLLPLRILPLELDCSVQVRQLMRGSLGSECVQNFTKRLTAALAQDLESPRATAAPPSSSSLPSSSPTLSPLPSPTTVAMVTQAEPLNLSRRGGVKRSAGDDTDLSLQHDGEDDGPSWTPVAKQPRLDADGLPLKPNGGVFRFPLFQDQPADLSLPCRVRAILRESRRLAAKGPDAAETKDMLPRPATTSNSTPCRSGVSPVVEEQNSAAGLGGPLPGVNSDLCRPGVNSDLCRPGVNSDLCRPGVNSDLCRPGVNSDLCRPGVNSDLCRPGVNSDLCRPGVNSAPCRSGVSPVVEEQNSAAGLGSPLPGVNSTPCRPGVCPTVEERSTAPELDGALGAAESRGAEGTLDGGLGGKSLLEVASEQLKHGKGDHTQLANRVQDTQGVYAVLPNGKLDALSDHSVLANVDSDAEGSHRKLANGEQDAQANGRTLAKCEKDIKDEHMALANGVPDGDSDDRALANGEGDAVGSFISLILPDSPPHSHCNSVASTLLS